MQAHDSVAVQEMAEENVTQYLGETVKLVRLEKTRDTPLVTHQLLVFFNLLLLFSYFFLHLYISQTCKRMLCVPTKQQGSKTSVGFSSQYVMVCDIFVTSASPPAFRLVSLCSMSFKRF